MKDENTICHKVTRSIEDMEKAMQTGNLDGLALVKRLHEIREQAQKMENGLRRRQKLMISKGIEEEYQQLKSKESKPTGINKIWDKREEQTPEKINFEVIIKRDGELIYQHEAHAGVISTVEKIENIDDMGQITGQTQKFVFGNPMVFWFAFDQLKTSIEARGMEILLSIQSAVKANKFADPEVKRKLMEATNKMKGNL
jgi:hypothetical protein